MHFKEHPVRSARTLIASMRPSLLASLPATPNHDKIADLYIERLLALLRSDAYTDRVIAAYANYFSDQEIKALAQFYATPIGQHYSAVMPQLVGDMNRIGQQLAGDNLPGILLPLCAEFPELQPDAPFCKQPDARQKSRSGLADAIEGRTE